MSCGFCESACSDTRLAHCGDFNRDRFDDEVKAAAGVVAHQRMPARYAGIKSASSRPYLSFTAIPSQPFSKAAFHAGPAALSEAQAAQLNCVAVLEPVTLAVAVLPTPLSCAVYTNVLGLGGTAAAL